MTQKKFKEAMLRGQGRCIQAAQSDPEKYRAVVLWACAHQVAYDPQWEGSKAGYVYRLINCYPDKGPFLEALVADFQKTKSDGAWKVLYQAELLGHFALDGEETAEAALWSKYEELYAALLKKGCLPKGIFPERDDFSMLCVELARNKKAMLKIAGDIGKLYLFEDFYDGDDFDWLFASCAKRYMGTLQKHAEKSENIAAYLRVGLAHEEKLEEMCRKIREMVAEGKRPVRKPEKPQPAEKTRLIDLVMTTKTDFLDTTSWHSIHIDVLRMVDHGETAPAEVLRHIYETNFCSCCRETAVRQMGKRRLLTEEMLQECLLDSNYDIQTYAQRCWARRNKK